MRSFRTITFRSSVIAAFALSTLLFGASCDARQAVPGGTQWTLTREGLGPVRLCASLDTVASVFSGVRDTLFDYLEDSWPARIANLDGGLAVFEASWADRGRIWTISVSSPAVRTPKGYRVGQTIRTLFEAGEELSVHEPEGQLLLGVDSEGIFLTVDSASEDRYFEGRYFARTASTTKPSIADVPSDARIRGMSVSVSRDCRDGPSP